MSTNLFSPEDREIIAAHIGEMDLTDDLLERFFASALDQASEKYEKALRGYRSVMSMRRAKDEPPPAPPVVPTPEEAVSDLMVNLRAALETHTGNDGRAPAPPPRDELQEQIDFIRWVMSSDTPAPAAEPHNFPENMSDRLADWAEPGDLTTDQLTEEVIQKLTKAKRKKFTELLNVELAELQQERGGPREDLKRENEIEALLGLFARVGEM